jgi:LPXTG-motif cell wall-anchored protein
MPEAARGAIDGGRALYRRGAIAVTETAGDNGALILLAGGAAAAGLSWLWLRARKRAR